MSVLTTLDLTLAGWIIASAIVFFAAIVQGGTGMGFGQVSASLLILTDPRFVPAAVIIMGMSVAAMGAIQGRHEVNRKQLVVALAGRIAGGIAAGHLMFLFIDSKVWSLVFAGMILLAVALSALTWRVLPTSRALLGAGLLSGFMGAITSIGAPPIGIVYQNVPGHEARSTMNAFFTLGTVASLATL